VKLVIAAMGRIKEPEVRALLDDYYGRVRRYASLEEYEVRDERPDRATEAFERVLANAGSRAEIIALEVNGKSLTSAAFAARVGEALDRAAVPVFAIGGPDGLPPAVSARAKWQLSLGAMTLPHRLARLVLAEQVYRAFTILKGESYNR
jgi:23S rRNA (pseudouridine1915-N3)-methyltransferase